MYTGEGWGKGCQGHEADEEKHGLVHFAVEFNFDWISISGAFI